MRKEIRVQTHGPLTADPTATVPWDDVWLSWKTRPGQPLNTDMVTLVGLLSLQLDIEVGRGLTADEASVDTRVVQLRELADLEGIERSILEDGDGLGYDTNKNVYTREECIDRKHAEKMLAGYLLVTHGIKRPKFNWRPSQYCVTPV